MSDSQSTPQKHSDQYLVVDDEESTQFKLEELPIKEPSSRKIPEKKTFFSLVLSKKQNKCLFIILMSVLLIFLTAYFALTGTTIDQTFEKMIPDRQINLPATSDKHYFAVSIRTMLKNSNLDLLYDWGKHLDMTYNITKTQHIRAVLMTQLVHSVNFKGEIVVDLSPFDVSQEKKRQAVELILNEEEQYYQNKYRLSQYEKQQLRFCLVIPSFNNVESRLYLRNIDSVLMQDYQNFHIVYVDDYSEDKTGLYVRKYLQQKQIPQNIYTVIINEERKKALANIYNAVHGYCPDGEVVGIVDGEDSLLGTKVLKLYNAIYQRNNALMVYSNFLRVVNNERTSIGFGRQLTKEAFQNNFLREHKDLIGTHFRTFYSDLFKKIEKKDFCYPNGTFYITGVDRAILTPIMEMAFPYVMYVPQILYEYRNDTGLNIKSRLWHATSDMIQAQSAYKNLQDFSFINKKILKIETPEESVKD